MGHIVFYAPGLLTKTIFMRMKKFFLFTSALLASATMMAQLVGLSAVEMSNETTAGTSTVNHLYTNEQGDIFFLGNSASNGEKPTISFDGITLDAAPYRVNQARTNTNIVFGKLSGKDASTQWFGASNRGAFTDYVATPAADGKLIMAVTAYFTDSNYLADNKVMSFNLQTADGTTAGDYLSVPYTPIISGTSTKFVQFGSIVEVSDKGFAFVQDLDQMAGQNAGFSFVDMTTDGTNVYVLVQLAPGVVVGKDTIKANVAAGSIAVLKFDDKWQLAGSVISDGLAGKASGSLKYVDGKLYYAGNLATTAGKSFVLGDKSVVASHTGNSVVLATLTTDLQCESMALVDAYKYNGKGGTFSLADELVSGNNAYLTGFYSGGIAIAENDTMTAATNSAFLLKVDLATGKLTNATRLNAKAITSGSSLFMHNDSIYMYAYNWSEQDGRVALYSYDAMLNVGDTIALLNAAGQEVTNSIVLTKAGKLAYSFRTKGTVTFSVAPETTYTAQGNAFRGVLAVQQLFENPEQAIDNTVAPAQKAEKFIHNGQLYIRRGNVVFNALGQQL